MLKASNGRYTDLLIERASHLIGSLGNHLDTLYQQNVGMFYSVQGSTSTNTEAIYRSDVAKFVSTYHDDQLLDCQPGRQHSAFPEFEYNEHIQNPEKLRTKLAAHCVKLDRGRIIHPDC